MEKVLKTPCMLFTTSSLSSNSLGASISSASPKKWHAQSVTHYLVCSDTCPCVLARKLQRAPERATAVVDFAKSHALGPPSVVTCSLREHTARIRTDGSSMPLVWQVGAVQSLFVHPHSGIRVLETFSQAGAQLQSMT